MSKRQYLISLLGSNHSERDAQLIQLINDADDAHVDRAYQMAMNHKGKLRILFALGDNLDYPISNIAIR